MITEQNYFAINRRLTDSDFWLSEEFTKPQAWVDLIGLSRHCDGTATIRGIEINLKRGQNCWSELQLSLRWKWSRNKVRRFLKTLETKQQILIEKNNVTTVMTITNYNLYQPSSNHGETPNETTERHQTKQQKDTRKTRSNNDNKEKKENNVVICTETQCDSVPEDVILTFDCKGPVKEWYLTQTKVKEWEITYEGIDVMASIRRARQWLLDNPLKAKTARGMSRFLGKWIASDIDRGRAKPKQSELTNQIGGVFQL